MYSSDTNGDVSVGRQQHDLTIERHVRNCKALQHVPPPYSSDHSRFFFVVTVFLTPKNDCLYSMRKSPYYAVSVQHLAYCVRHAAH